MTELALKPGWQWVKFGNVVKLSGERRASSVGEGLERYVGLEHLEPGDLRIRRWGNISDGTTFTSYFKPGQVLFGKRRAYQRKVAVADFEGVCSGDIYVFEPKDKQLLPELLPFICQTDAFFDYAVGTSAGSLSPRTNWKSLAQYEFALPPLEVQKQLYLSLKAAQDVMEARTTVELTANKLVNAASKNLFESLLDEVPSFVPLRQLSQKNAQSGLYKPQEQYGVGTLVVHMNELFGNDIITAAIEMPKVELSATDISRYKLTNNDLLFGRRSIVLEGAGRCVLVNVDGKLVAFESSILRVTLDKKQILSTFAFEWFRSPQGQRYVQSIKTFTTVAGVKGSDVDKLPIPLPSLKEQQYVVHKLGSLRQTLQKANKSAGDAKIFFNLLLNRLFSVAI